MSVCLTLKIYLKILIYFLHLRIIDWIIWVSYNRRVGNSFERNQCKSELSYRYFFAFFFILLSKHIWPIDLVENSWSLRTQKSFTLSFNAVFSPSLCRSIFVFSHFRGFVNIRQFAKLERDCEHVVQNGEEEETPWVLSLTPTILQHFVYFSTFLGKFNEKSREKHFRVK